MYSPMKTRYSFGFTIVELLVVLSIMALLVALLFPVMASAFGKARQATCLSNLNQIGLAVTMYTQDYDGMYPYAVDPVDKYTNVWISDPVFAKQIPNLPLIQNALMPFVHSKEIFCCPSDTGFIKDDLESNLIIDPQGNPPGAMPTSFKKFGTSYYYDTPLAAFHAGDSSIVDPSEVSLLFDGSGVWHSELMNKWVRINAVFADGHCKLDDYYQFSNSFFKTN